jgi:hypothetical protein
VQTNGSETTHIFHKNRQISFLAMKKKHSKVNTSSRSHRKFQTTKDKNKQKTEKLKTKPGPMIMALVSS